MKSNGVVFMRYAAIFAMIFVAFLFLGCLGPDQSTGASNLPDFNVYSSRVNETGIVGPYELRAAYSRHVFTIWSTNATQLVNTTTFTATTVRSCDNTTVNASIDVCANTSAVGTGNFTTYKANTTYSMTLATANDAFNNSTGTFDLAIYGTNLNQANSSDTAYVFLYKPNAGGGVFEKTVYYLQANTTNWTNITGLSKADYVSSLGVVTVKFEAATSNANASKAGITIDYLGFNGSNTYNFTGGSIGNVTFQTSLDNRNWFTDATVSNVGVAVRTQTNQTALYARFNVTALTLTDASQDAIYIQYVAVSN